MAREQMQYDSPGVQFGGPGWAPEAAKEGRKHGHTMFQFLVRRVIRDGRSHLPLDFRAVDRAPPPA